MTSRRALEDDLARLAGLLASGDVVHLRTARVVVSAMRRSLRVVRADPVDPGQERLMLRMPSDFPVSDCPLGCPVSAVVCVARQIQSDLETKGTSSTRRCVRRADPGRPVELARHDGKRGTLASRPTCVTAHCPVGAFVREAHGDTAEAKDMARRAPRCTDTSE